MKKVLNFSLLVLILVFSTGCRHFKSEKSDNEEVEETEEKCSKKIEVSDLIIYSSTDMNGNSIMRDSVISGNRKSVLHTPYQIFYILSAKPNFMECGYDVLLVSKVTSELFRKELQKEYGLEDLEPDHIDYSLIVSEDWTSYELYSVYIYDKNEHVIACSRCYEEETPTVTIKGNLIKDIRSMAQNVYEEFKEENTLEDLSGEWICNDPEFTLELTLSHDVSNETLTVKECAIYRHAIWDKAKGSIDKKHINITQEDGFDGSIKLDLEPQGKDILEGSCHAEGQVKFNGRITLERKPTNNAKYFLGQREWTAYEYKKTYADATENLILQFRGDILMMDGEYIIQDGNCFGGDYSTNGYNISIVIRNGYSDMLGLPQRFKGKFSKDMKKLTLKNVLNKKSLVLHLNENLPTPPERDFNRMY